MKELTSIIVSGYKTRCPHCEEIESDWFAPPRGEETECDFCGEMYRIHKEADLVEEI